MASSARLRPGVRLGPYRVEAFIGEGAMGRVYRAVDSRLGRAVALKVLPEDLLSNPEHFARLQREAKAASALNHPNIVTVYEVGEQVLSASGEFAAGSAAASDSGRFIPFLAMEYVDGKSLRQILASGPLTLRKTLDLGVQASEALSRAHEAGIVHRDLKPDNMMIRSDGYLKILDFGLARVTAPGDNPSAARTYDAGYFVVGTASYMSPEQARGKAIDGRSDIFSLGIVLYEALSGRAPFPGDTAVDTLSSILNKDPISLAESAPDAPRDLSRTIERCLEKDVNERCQSMRELSLELKAIRRDLEGGLISAGARRTTGAVIAPKRRFSWPFAAAGAVVLAAAIPVWRWRATQPQASVIRLTSSGRAIAPAISPDGSMIAYIEDAETRKLRIQQMGSEAALAIDTGGLLPASPAFSNDGKWIYYAANSVGIGPSLFRSPTLGGAPQRLGPGYRSQPSPDGQWLAFLRESTIPGVSFDLCVSSIEGENAGCAPGGPEPSELFAFSWMPDSSGLDVVRSDVRTTSAVFGRFDRASRRLTLSGSSTDRLSIMVNGFARDPISPSFYLTGSAIYGRGGDLTRRSGSDLAAITSGVADYRGLSIDAAGRTAVTADYRENSNILRVELTGHPADDSARAQMLTSDNEGDYRPVWSPDGSRIAFISTRTRHRSVWLMNADGSGQRELTPDHADYGWPAWSPDGRRLSYACNRTGNHEIYVANVFGAGGPARRLTDSRVFNGQSWWAPDGRTIYYESADASEHPILKRIAADGTGDAVVAPEDLEFPAVSPDGQYVSATSGPLTGEEIPLKVLRLADRTIVFETRISRLGHLATWMPDSKSLVAVRRDPDSGGVNVYAIPLDGAAPTRLTSFPLSWQTSIAAIDATGKRLLVVRYRNNSDIVAIGPLRGPTFWEFLARKGS